MILWWIISRKIYPWTQCMSNAPIFHTHTHAHTSTHTATLLKAYHINSFTHTHSELKKASLKGLRQHGLLGRPKRLSSASASEIERAGDGRESGRGFSQEGANKRGREKKLVLLFDPLKNLHQTCLSVRKAAICKLHSSCLVAAYLTPLQHFTVSPSNSAFMLHHLCLNWHSSLEIMKCNTPVHRTIGEVFIGNGLDMGGHSQRKNVAGDLSIKLN